MAESDAVRIAREYRQQLVNNEDAALKEMAKYWLKMERDMSDQYKLLAQEIKDLRESGQPVPRQFVRTRNRYQYMLAQLQKNLGEFDAEAERIIKKNQKENYILGLDSATEIIEATKPTASIWNRVYNEAAELMAGFAANGAPLGELLRHDYGETASDILDALVSGIALGKGVNEVAKDMEEAMAGDFRRAVLIARTETNRAYRIANAEQYEASGVVTRVLRLCYPPTACFACLMMDGEECPRGICDDHPNGKCTTIVETIGGVRPTWETGQEWFLKQSPEDQRRIMGAGRYDLWKNQGVSLRDMVFMKVDPVWGGNPSVKTLGKLKEEFNINTPDSPTPPPTPITNIFDLAMSGEKFDNDTVRDLYNNAVANIVSQIDTTQSLERQAKQAFELRNAIRTAARDIMADTEARNSLDRERPNVTFEQLLNTKMIVKGLSRDEALRDIIKSASRTNEEVNSRYGRKKR